MRASLGIGPGWRQLAERAEQDLHRAGFAGEVIASISAEGGLVLAAEPRARSAADILAGYVSRAYITFERCGGGARTRSGAVLVFLCDDCSA